MPGEVTVIFGTFALAAANDIASQTDSIFRGYVSINTSTTFQWQHQCTVTQNIDGLGQAAAFGLTGIYSAVKVLKLN